METSGIKDVIICGLGAVGLTYACKLKDFCRLKILADEARIKKYTANKPSLNGVEQDFEYVLPSEHFEADLIIIAVKSYNLKEAISSIKNFTGSKTKIISLLNGISSEREISSAYPDLKVLKSYFIGHSAVRNENSVTQDGVGKIVFEGDSELEAFFDYADVDYEIPADIDYSMWLKFTMNLFSNQVSAILKMSFGEMKNNGRFSEFAKKITAEVSSIAEKNGVQNLKNLEKDVLSALASMCDEGKTSMHQDIIAGRKTEVDIFAGEIIRQGERLGIPTPYNRVLYDLIKIEEERNEYRIHSSEGREQVHTA